MSDTPRTDAHLYTDGHDDHADLVSAEFARQLERELNKALEVLCYVYNNASDTYGDRNDMRWEDYDILKNIAEMAFVVVNAAPQVSQPNPLVGNGESPIAGREPAGAAPISGGKVSRSSYINIFKEIFRLYGR